MSTSDDNTAWEIVGNSSLGFDFTKAETITVGLPTGLNNIASSSLSIYPNPVKDILCITNEESEIQSVKIMDLSGRLLKADSFSENNTQVNVPVADLNAGTYIVVIQTGSGTETKKIIKM